MGQQQLLLIVLGVIVVGVAVAFAIGLFRGNAITTKRDMLLNESGNIAAIGTIVCDYWEHHNMGCSSWGWRAVFRYCLCHLREFPIPVQVASPGWRPI